MYSEGAEDENYLRGVQAPDAPGGSFTKHRPGRVLGRWPHIHFEVYASPAEATSSGNTVSTTQLALPKDVRHGLRHARLRAERAQLRRRGHPGLGHRVLRRLATTFRSRPSPAASRRGTSRT